jgi:2-oxoglutarate ferredoxin oxidoreductase subunit delta
MNCITIDKTKCKACYLCIDVCPKKLIKKGIEANRLGAFPVEFEDLNNECLGCALCAMRCPDLAIMEVIKLNG